MLSIHNDKWFELHETKERQMSANADWDGWLWPWLLEVVLVCPYAVKILYLSGLNHLDKLRCVLFRTSFAFPKRPKNSPPPPQPLLFGQCC